MLISLLINIILLDAAPSINYYGWDVVGFWYRQVTERFFDFSWQIRVAYAIVLVSLITVLILIVIFSNQIRTRNQKERAYRQCKERFEEHFDAILLSPVHLSVVNIESICECSVEDFHDFSGETFSKLICLLRMKHHKKVYLPNVQLLCDLTDVTSYVEESLKRGRDVELIFQLIDTLALRISEGRLAVYTNHRDGRIRRLARLCLMICTDSDPFRYLEEDLNEDVAPSHYISLHRLFGWLAATNRQMPPFLTIAEHVKDEEGAAFMIEEVGYWGNDVERRAVSKFFMSEHVPSRIAAIRVVSQLKDKTREAELVASYRLQPEDVQLEILDMIRVLQTGEQAAFLEKSYITAPSKALAEKALFSLFMYGTEGRARFERLRQTPLDRRSRNLLDQIESMGILEQLRAQSVADDTVAGSVAEADEPDVSHWIAEHSHTAENFDPEDPDAILPGEENVDYLGNAQADADALAQQPVEEEAEADWTNPSDTSESEEPESEEYAQYYDDGSEQYYDDGTGMYYDDGTGLQYSEDGSGQYYGDGSDQQYYYDENGQYYEDDANLYGEGYADASTQDAGYMTDDDTTEKN